MKKYKDSFDTRAESLEKGGSGIVVAVANNDPQEREPRPRSSRYYKNGSSVSPIRTLADDIEQSTRDGKVTLSQQALEGSRVTQENLEDASLSDADHPSRAYHARVQRAKQGSRHSKSLLFLLCTLLIFSVSLYRFTSQQGIGVGDIAIPLPWSAPIEKSEEASDLDSFFPIIALRVDTKEALPIDNTTNREALRAVLKEKSRDTQTGSLTALFPTFQMDTPENSGVQFVGIDSILEIINVSVKDVLTRNVNTYTLGVSGAGEARAFLVADVSSYEEVLSGLLRWERTMPRELYGFFHNNLSLATGNSVQPFMDIVVSGNDARVLTSIDGDDVLIYSLANNRLVVTHSRDELAHIFSRF